MIKNQHDFVLGFSVFVLVVLHQLGAKAGTEVRCRVVVEDTPMLIKLKYLVECLILPGICFLLSIPGLMFQ